MKKRTQDKEYKPCPICGKRPYIDIYGINMGKAYCKGSILNKHKVIETSTEYFQSSKLMSGIKDLWNIECFMYVNKNKNI